MKQSIIVTSVLGVISLVWLILDFLALTDIKHGNESDLALEWLVVATGFIPFFLFIASVFVLVVLTGRIILRKDT